MKKTRRGLLGLCLAYPIWAKRAMGDPRASLSYVCAALADGNAADALRPFDRGMAEYERLSDYFAALTASYGVSSSVEVSDITDGVDAKLVECTWTVTLTPEGGGSTNPRVRPERIKFVRRGQDWKIVSLSDVSIFAP